MSDFTDDTKRPDYIQDGKHPRHECIEATQGIWVRKNYAANQIEIWFDGHFQASWAGADQIENRLTTMLRTAFESGQREQRKQTAQQLRKLLGL